MSNELESFWVCQECGHEGISSSKAECPECSGPKLEGQ